MLQTTSQNIVPSLHLLWEERAGLDGLFLCRDGSVPFSRLVLASHSPVLAGLLAAASFDTEEETQKIVINNFSMVTVRSLVQLLHGCPAQTFWFSQLQELSLLLETLQISLTSEKAASLQESLETNCDVVITKQVQSNKRKRKTYGQTKQYRDWSKAGPDQVTVKEEPLETEKTPHVFTKVTYSKHYSLQLPGLSHDMDHSYKKRKMEAATPSKADIQLGSSIMVTPVAAPPEPVLAEESVLEQETVTTLIINNDQPSLAQESFIIQTVPARPLKKARSSNNPPGEVKTEEEAKAMAAPFIGKVETKPPKYRCMFDDCSYVNARLLMTQTHVYKHLQVFTFQCSYCDLKCRLETNFEKHLNTHGMTRRKEKVGQFIFIDDKSEVPATPSAALISAGPRAETVAEMNQFEPPAETLLSAAEAERKAVEFYSSTRLSGPSQEGPTSFSCLICAGTSSQFECSLETVMRSHVLKHLNIYTEECPACGQRFRSSQLLQCHQEHCRLPDQTYVVLEHQDQSLLEEDKPQHQNYHLRKKAILLGEEKARPIISSYIKYNVGKEEEGENTTNVTLQCSICQFEAEAETEVFEHIALQHLNIYQYTCDLCSKKVKIKRQLVEHMITEHGEEMEGPRPQSSSVASDTSQETAGGSGGMFEEDEFPYSEHNMSVRVAPNGAKKVYVGDAKFPLLRLNKSVLNKLVKGKMMSKKEADEIVSVYAIHNTGSKWYECSLCDGTVRKEKLYLIQRHLYEHFNFYFMRCPLCNDIFRFTSQFKEHQEAHQKLLRKTQEEGRPGSKEDKIGNYHEAADYHYIPEEEAKTVVDSYYIHDDSECVYICKICSDVQSSQTKMFNHCLKQHLKIFQYKCDLCDEFFQLDIEIKRHYKRTHGKQLEKNSKLDKLSRNQEHYESTETDFPDIQDLSTVPMELLKGKKISTKQAKSIKGRHMLYNEETRMHECELCEFRREWRGNLQNHVLAQHYDVFLYRCPGEDCQLLLRNWSAFQAHQKSHRHNSTEKTSEEEEEEEDGVKYDQLEAPLYVGEQKGLKIARRYHSLDKTSGLSQCRLCEFSAKAQTVSIHVLAKHLPHLYLYRCEFCEKTFRYSRVRWREHQALHTQGRLACPDCEGEQGKLYTSESLKAHRRRNHSQGRFDCSLAECELVFNTKAEARQHEKEVHLLGLPAKFVSHVCEWCDYSFPTRSRWKKHVVLCQRGTSRTGFRKQISDVLEWLGKGGWRCTFCNAEFHPDADNVTGTALPEARNHVASLHGMKHMRKAKMQWHGDPKNINKEDMYKDKTNFWSAKAKDIDRMRSEDKTYEEEMMDPDKKAPGTVIMKIVNAEELESETIVEDGLVDHHQVVVNIVNEDGVVEQRQVLLGQSELYLDSEGSQVSSEIFSSLGLEQDTVIVKDMKAENVEFGEVNSITIVDNQNLDLQS